MARSLPGGMAVLGSLLLAGCPPTHEVRSSFAPAYRSARVVAILPPRAQVVVHTGSDAIHPEWSEAGYDAIAAELQESLEARDLRVAWVQWTPETTDAIVEADAAIAAVGDVPLGSPEVPFTERGRRWQEHQQAQLSKTIEPLLDLVSGDLLLVAWASGVVQTSEGQVFDFLGALGAALLGQPGPEMKSTASSLRVTMVDRAGRVIYVGRGWTRSALMSPGAAKGLVAEALGGLPRPSHEKAFGEPCVISAECQSGLACPYGRCIRAAP